MEHPGDLGALEPEQWTLCAEVGKDLCRKWKVDVDGTVRAGPMGGEINAVHATASGWKRCQPDADHLVLYTESGSYKRDQ